MAQTTKIIPFDWEYYQANKDKCRVITSHREPIEITQLTKFECEDSYCLIGIGENKMKSWKLENDDLQLEVTEEVVEGYANLYIYKPTGQYVISVAFDTKQKAEEYIVVNDETHEFIATIALHEIEKQTNK